MHTIGKRFFDLGSSDLIGWLFATILQQFKMTFLVMKLWTAIDRFTSLPDSRFLSGWILADSWAGLYTDAQSLAKHDYTKYSFYFRFNFEI